MQNSWKECNNCNRSGNIHQCNSGFKITKFPQKNRQFWKSRLLWIPRNVKIWVPSLILDTYTHQISALGDNYTTRYGVSTILPRDARTYVRTSRWEILFTTYLVVGLSRSAEIWCVYVASINDGTQILTFLGIHNNRYFQNSQFFCGDLYILNPEFHWFPFPDRLQLLHFFPELCTHS